MGSVPQRHLQRQPRVAVAFTVIAFFMVIEAPRAGAQERPPLPFAVAEDAIHRVGTDQLAKAPRGLFYDIPPFGAAGLDSRNPTTAMPAGGGSDAVFIALYHKAEARFAAGAFLKAATLYSVIAPQAPNAGPWLHLKAAVAFARGGDVGAAKVHLQRAEGAARFNPEAATLARAEILMSEDADAALAAALEGMSTNERASTERCDVLARVMENVVARAKQVPPVIPDLTRPEFGNLHTVPSACNLRKTQVTLEVLFKNLKKTLDSDSRRILQTTLADRMLKSRIDFKNVRNKSVEDDLKAILSLARLPAWVACEANYMMSVTMRRTRRRKESPPFASASTKACLRVDRETAARYGVSRLRIASLYYGAQGAAPDKARARCEAVLAEAPHSSYADNALFTLIELCDKSGETERAAQLRARLERDHGSGDAVQRPRWDKVWPLIRTSKWEAALPYLEAGVELGEDSVYYGQGRFDYYLGRAYDQLGRAEDASIAFRRGAAEHPTAFYGHLALQNLHQSPNADDRAWAASRVRPIAAPIQFNLKRAEIRGLVWLGEFAEAGKLIDVYNEETPVHDKWLSAYLSHLGGDFSRSHNVARRRIRGFPQDYGSPTSANRLLWEIAYPVPHKNVVQHWAKTHGVDPFLMWSIMREESGFVADIVSYAGAVGLMQLMLPTAKGNAADVGGRIDRARLSKPDVNIPIAARLLNTLSRQFDGHPVLMAASYNAGPRPPTKWLASKRGMDIGIFAESMAYSQARNYSRRVVGSYHIYQWLWGEEDVVLWGLNAGRGPKVFDRGAAAP